MIATMPGASRQDLLARVVDADSHILETPDLWTSRLPSKWADYSPRVLADPATGQERWNVAGKFISGAALYASAEWTDYWPSRPPTFEAATRGAWDPLERLAWMDRVGIHAQVQYPNLLGFHVWAFLLLDPEIRLACVQAFNDFQTEFCAADPSRLIPVSYLPWWDIDASIRELDRCIAMGHHAVNLGSHFEKMGFPRLRSEHWHPLLHAIEDRGIPVNFHIGFGNRTEEELQTSVARDTLDHATESVLFMIGNVTSIAELIMGGVCHNFPTLKFVSVESGFGYIPYFLEALDWQFLNVGGRRYYGDRLLPSEYFRRQIYATFWFEKHLVELVHLYPDNIMFETDYPHGTSLSPGPNSLAKSARDTIAENLSQVPDDILGKILYGNAANLYNLA